MLVEGAVHELLWEVYATCGEQASNGGEPGCQGGLGEAQKPEGGDQGVTVPVDQV